MQLNAASPDVNNYVRSNWTSTKFKVGKGTLYYTFETVPGNVALRLYSDIYLRDEEGNNTRLRRLSDDGDYPNGGGSVKITSDDVYLVFGTYGGGATSAGGYMRYTQLYFVPD